jgi:hypothetical protein
MEVEASPLVPRRMMARLVHIPYQLFQPNEFDSIIDSARAFEMPEEPSPKRRCSISGARARCSISGARAPQPTRSSISGARAPQPTRSSISGARAPQPTRSSISGARAPQPAHGSISGARAPQPAHGSISGARAPQPTRGLVSGAPASARPPMGHRSGTQDVLAEFPARLDSVAPAFAGHAPRAGAPHRGDPIPKPGALWQCPFSIRLPSRPACGIFSLRARATAPQRVPHRRAPLPPPPPQPRLGDARMVRAPACLPSCFIMLRNTSHRRRGRTAQLVLGVLLVLPRRICYLHASASRPMGKPC